MNSRKTKNLFGALIFIFMVLISLCGSNSVQAAPGITGVEDGGAYNTDVTLSEEGTYTVTFNNNTPITFMIDKTAPIIDGVNDGETYDHDVTFTCSDINGSGLESIKLDGVEKLTSEEISNHLSSKTLPLSAGGHLVVTDRAGNNAELTFSIVKKPVITSFGYVEYGLIDEDAEWTHYSDWALRATGTSNGTSLSFGPENVVVKTVTGQAVTNYFDSYWGASPAFGMYRVYIKDVAGNLSKNYLLVDWSGNGRNMKPINDTVAPSVTIDGPSSPLARTGDTVKYNVKLSDDVRLYKATLTAGDIIINAESATGTVSSVEDKGNNEYVVSVKINSITSPCAMSITVAAGIAEDYMENKNATKTSTAFTADNQIEVFQLTGINISSNITGYNQFAKVGSTVTLAIYANRDFPVEPIVNIMDKPASLTGSGNIRYATYTLQSGDKEGKINFKIDCKDIHGNIIASTTNTSDASTVTFDKSGPACNLKPYYNISNGTVVIPARTDVTGEVKIIEFIENGVVEDFPVSLPNDGNYSLTLEDAIGNRITYNFCIDKVKPVINDKNLTYLGHFYGDESEWYSYEAVAIGTDQGSGIATDGTSALVKMVSGSSEIEITNRFEYEMFYDGSDTNNPAPGNYRVYCVDRAGNVSVNYVDFVWSGGL